MTRLPLLALLLAAPLALTACGGDTPAPVESAADAPEPLGTAPAPTDAPAEPQMVDGVQVVEVVAGPMGFQPREITIQAGVPARLVVTRTVEDDCSSQISIPTYGVPATDLPLNEPVSFDLQTDEPSEIEFVCGMDMQRGTIVVAS
ncbi:cupredoxin domain-containing protein [Rubrivirga sp. S365]|uniref:cupredoxin domain-containing protein n=1 Tax=Rubrivirga sp. S365 TaxID=3076080 RepID=UPI0028C955AD|nr:cupredoxin domain-containing protein [Rubrivirga sp. S365]MDT7858240.1 cupredoxin domain-containing protein [Rubrivirga sp. S365]